jgi:hypothetical protein
MDFVWPYCTLFENPGQCLTEIFSPTFIHSFGHILLTGCPIDPILFHWVHNFKGIIYKMLVSVFITFFSVLALGIEIGT